MRFTTTRGKIGSLRKASPTVSPLEMPSLEILKSAALSSLEPTASAVVSIASSIGVPLLKREAIVEVNRCRASLYKIFQSDSSGCVDGTNTCTKTWDGAMSSGGLIQDGLYKIKVHIKDSSDNEFYDYLTPYNITVDTSL